MRKKEFIDKLKEYEDMNINLHSKINRLEQRLTAQREDREEQLRCAEKGHKWVFNQVANNRPYDGWVWISVTNGTGYFDKVYQFKCSNCDLTITYTKDELSVNERKALKELGILE